MPLSEADTRAKLIDPAIYARGWSEDMICRETTLGAVEILGGKARRRAGGRTDYMLRVRVSNEAQPVAVALIEAKKDTLPPGHGLDQAKGYLAASRHNVLFVFSSNGYLFVEFDRTTGMTTPPRPLSEFPSAADLRARYEKIMGFSLEEPVAKPLLARYVGGEGRRRYFQDAAIRAVFEKVAQSVTAGRPPRALLSLATGTGKTFIACNLLKRIADAGQLKRALFLCDRDELRTQGLKAMQAVFGSDAAEVYEENGGRNHAKNARVHVATYQTLGIDREGGDPSFLFRHYPENYFSHIIIDECHRSAWGKWSVVLTRNANAVQIGLTATPRQIACSEDTQEARADAEVTADNLRYFGEPVYEYGLAQAMEDGYLAACEIQMAQVNLDATGLTAADIVSRNPRNDSLAAADAAKRAAENRLAAAESLSAAYLCDVFEGTEARTWELRRIGSVAPVQTGFAFKSEWFVAEDGVRLLRNANIHQGFVEWVDVVAVGNRFAERFAEYSLRLGDIVLTLDRPIVASGPKVARITLLDLPTLLNQPVARFRINPSLVDADYLYAFLRSPTFVNAIRGHDQSLGVPHISPAQVQNVQIPLPPLAVQTRVAGELRHRLQGAKSLVAASRDELVGIDSLPAALLRAAFNGDS